MSEQTIETRVINGRSITGTPDNFVCHALLNRLLDEVDATTGDISRLLNEVGVITGDISRAMREGRVDAGYKLLLTDALRVSAQKIKGLLGDLLKE